MSVPPLLLAVARGLVVLRIGRPLAPVIFTAPLPLAVWPGAHFVLGTIDRRRKPTLAMRPATRRAQPEDCSGTQDEIGKEGVLRMVAKRNRWSRPDTPHRPLHLCLANGRKGPVTTRLVGE
jgi:hypothetical protein